MTSEERFEIPAQPGDTCPMIDEVLVQLRDAQKAIKGFEREDEADELRAMIDRVESELFMFGDAASRLERIRAHVIEIREWGAEWKQCALKMAADAAQETETC